MPGSPHTEQDRWGGSFDHGPRQLYAAAGRGCTEQPRNPSHRTNWPPWLIQVKDSLPIAASASDAPPTEMASAASSAGGIDRVAAESLADERFQRIPRRSSSTSRYHVRTRRPPQVMPHCRTPEPSILQKRKTLRLSRNYSPSCRCRVRPMLAVRPAPGVEVLDSFRLFEYLER